MLAVIQHKQKLLVGQEGQNQGQRPAGGLVAQGEGSGCGVGYERGIPHLSEFDQPGAVGESPAEVGGAPHSKAGLPHTARPDEADDPC